MVRSPGTGRNWTLRVVILIALLMLVTGIAMTSGYFGGMPETASTGATPTSESGPVQVSTPTSETTRLVAQVSPMVTTATPPVEARATPERQTSQTPGVVSYATAMALSVQSTSVAVATAEIVATSTSAAEAVAQATSAAAGTTQAIDNANATATAVVVAQAAASQQAQQAQQAQATQQAQQTQQAQAQATQQAQQAQATAQPQPVAAGPTLPVVFESDHFKGIELASAAREQFGQGAVLYSRCEGLNCWYVKARGQVRPLDMKRAVLKQYGEDWTLVAIGAGMSDWRAVKLSDLNYMVLPVMLVSSDRLNHVEGIKSGLDRFRTVLANSQYWYYRQVGKTFRLAQPVIVTTERTSAQWNNLSSMNTNKDQFAEAIWTQYARQLPAPGNSLRVVVAPYTGENYSIAQGALSMPGFAVAPALSTSLWCPQSGPLDKTCQSASYLVGQALGLSFGLSHSCSAYPKDPVCRISLMQAGKPPSAVLLRPEIEKLKQSPFFTRY